MNLLKRFKLAIIIAFGITLLTIGAVYAATWEYKYPTVVTDNSSTTRVYIPVVLGWDGQTFIDAGKINSSGNDTNMQIGATSVKYMLSTDNVVVVIPSLPANGKQTVDFYTGYSPEQTGFTYAVGHGGAKITVPDNAALEPSANFSITCNNTYLNTTAGSNKKIFNHADYNIYGGIDCYVDTTTSGKINALIGTVLYPTIANNATTADAVAVNNHPITMPAPITAGNLLLMVFSASGSGGFTVSSGWTALSTDANGLDVAYYKTAVGGDTANITTVNANTIAAVVFQITNWSSISTTTYVTGVSANPDSPSYNTTTQKLYLWIATQGNLGATATTVFPAGYINTIQAAGTGGAHVSLATISTNATTENPGTFTLAGADTWSANTIAISPTIVGKTVSATGVSSGEHDIEVSADSNNLTIKIDGVTANSTALLGTTCANTTANWTIMSNNTSVVMSYMDEFTIYVGGTRQLYFDTPTSMLSGTNIPDSEATGGSNNGTITWGSNTNLVISYGEMISYESYLATITDTGGFDTPAVSLPSTWFASGENLANLPFYDSFLDVSLSTGQPPEVLYFLAILGFAFGAFLLLAVFSKSALLGALGFNIVLFIGSSMSVVPMWIPVVTLIVMFGILYLYRQVAY